MKNILVPIGISPNGKSTLAYAVELAKHFKASLFVIDSYNAASIPAQISSAKEVINSRNFKRVKELVKSVQTDSVDIKMVNYKGDLITGIESLDKKIGLDLIVVGPRSNDINEKLFLGKISGKIIKKTSIPVLLVPIDYEFSIPKQGLFAFKKGKIKGEQSLAPLKVLIKAFKTKVNLLLVKTPGHEAARLDIDHEVVELSEGLVSLENASVYQGVLIHFQSIKPEILIVFARKRGFFEKLMESDVVYKKDFFSIIPLLVLKNR
jgi:nucleotide-binding universal stress UspA family protein